MKCLLYYRLSFRALVNLFSASALLLACVCTWGALSLRATTNGTPPLKKPLNSYTATTTICATGSTASNPRTLNGARRAER